ncbi:helix-turn-helix domain-containing protein [Microbacterium sp. NPDC016588]
MSEHLELALVDIARDVAAIRDPDLLFRMIAERTRAVLLADMAYVSLNDIAAERTAVRATSGVRTEAYSRIAMPLGTGVLGLAAGGSVVTTRDYLADTRRAHLTDIDAAVAGEGVRAIAGVPLMSGGHVLGALMVAHRSVREFTDAEIGDLVALGYHAACAAELVRARTDLRDAGDRLEEATRESDYWRRRAALRTDLTWDSTVAQIVQAVEREFAVSVAILDVAGVIIESPRIPLELPDVGGLMTALGDSDTSVVIRDGFAAGLVAGLDRPFGVALVSPPPPPGVVEDLAEMIAVAHLRTTALASSQQRVQQELLADLHHFRDGDTAVVRRAAGSQIFSDTSLIAVAVMAAPGRSPSSVAALRAHVADRGLVSTIDGVIHVLLRSDTTLDVLDDVERVLGGALPPGSATGCAGPIVGLARIADGFAEARAVARAQRSLGRVDAIADRGRLGIAGMLLGGGSAAVTDDFIRRQLGSLADAENPRGGELLKTLRVYFDSGENLARTAQVLGRHINTVRQRLDRLDALLGPTWRTERRLDVHVALTAHTLRRANVAPSSA